MPKDSLTSRNLRRPSVLSRRAVFRDAGVALCLPLLDAMKPAFASGSNGKTAKRFIGVSLAFGLHNASSHDTKNMPVLFAVVGFRHGQHLAFDRQNNDPLPNLFVSALQRLGIEQVSFATSTGTIIGLE